MANIIGDNPSHLCRNILRARFIVRGAARWSIGQGNCIPILDELWLLNGAIFQVIQGAHFVSHTSINSLMDPYFK